jgi:hypothetical protein
MGLKLVMAVSAGCMIQTHAKLLNVAQGAIALRQGMLK